jgi:(S)-ureidoglycine aminohydrolase
MYMANLAAEGSAGPPPEGAERFVFVLDGQLEAEAGGESISLHADMFLYLPAHAPHQLSSTSGAGLLLFERRCALGQQSTVLSGRVASQPVLPVEGEVFLLRKLLPAGAAHDFNVHVMDFAPGQFLNVKEVHYNQHGLLLLAGQGVYRLGDSWYPVQAGDAIWMAPYVVQWYAALGERPSRYILYKDTTVDPGLY